MGGFGASAKDWRRVDRVWQLQLTGYAMSDSRRAYDREGCRGRARQAEWIDSLGHKVVPHRGSAKHACVLCESISHATCEVQVALVRRAAPPRIDKLNVYHGNCYTAAMANPAWRKALSHSRHSTSDKQRSCHTVWPARGKALESNVQI